MLLTSRCATASMLSLAGYAARHSSARRPASSSSSKVIIGSSSVSANPAGE